ncbi:hypothetical protein [Nitrosomonas marina]|uniref:Uncharacterized protein n=1 Tax=Nitrosomonas marina TaxID=917 RepID=A0A1H8GHY0_9PROT|nr:hypothetical protein [Nitrosomonas marina]SEN43761.1 hypothetical protein SAMN05216325_11841 [Nitrosomonas marina]
MSKIDAKYVRENMPECVAFADHCRELFGDDVRMTWAKENGIELGQQLTGDVVKLSEIDLTPMDGGKRR